MNALYRPGPMDLIPDFIDRKHGKTRWEYLDPRLKDILEPTYGIMMYQEQVMKIAQVLGGYTLGGADLLRRAMGKKKPEEMAQAARDLHAGRDGARPRGAPRPRRSSTRWRSSRATASTSRTPRRTRWSPTRPRT